MRVLGGCVQHVYLGKFELPVDVGFVHGIDASNTHAASAALLAAGITTPVEPLCHDLYALFSRRVLYERALACHDHSFLVFVYCNAKVGLKDYCFKLVAVSHTTKEVWQSAFGRSFHEQVDIVTNAYVSHVVGSNSTYLGPHWFFVMCSQ